MSVKKGLFSVVALLCLFGMAMPACASDAGSVSAREESLTIPTYRIGKPDHNPIFYSGRAYQGAKGPVYPYPILDTLTDIRENKSYHAVYLENQYVQFCILPEIGGRIFSAFDKTDNYDFIYHQHVIKPSLIGMLGAWISGGIEWNVPHHHRASTFMPVEHSIEINPDGSKTVWVGEMELRHRMRWIVGLTLFPDKSYVQATVKVINRTPVAQSMLYFANVAVAANKDYQVIFPPSTEFATYHGKNEFLSWPISDREFGGAKFDKPTDVSWWKSHPSPTSWFAWNYQEDFLGGYDHGKQAGIVHIADHHFVPGKKFFEWGTGGDGAMWDKILTEKDGDYLELMAGAYSDNQPDYSWIQPNETRVFSQYWYPIRNLDGIKNANLDAAMNLELKPSNVARIAFNTTYAVPGAKVELTANGKVIFQETAEISPEKPYVKEIPVPAGTREQDLKGTLYAADNHVLVSYQAAEKKNDPKPEAVKPPLPPKDIKTIDELYFAGLRLEQFYNPILEPLPYYEEALRRDPGDYRVNTQLGIYYDKRGMFKEAEEHLRTAIARATRGYTSPKDGEAFYYLGVALRAQGKLDDAYNQFYKAAWNSALVSPASFQLAEIASLRGNYTQALEHLARALNYNALDVPALNLKAALLRRTGHTQEAVAVTKTAQSVDPLNLVSLNEAGLNGSDSKASEQLKAALAEEPEYYLEAAIDYGNAGLWDEGINLLNAAAGSQNASAIFFYHKGYLQEMKGEKAAATESYRKAASMSPEYVFPFRWESAEALRHAMANNPQDAHAPYYLGNLLYDNQPTKAIEAWEKSVALDPSYATAQRNLGFAYARVEKNVTKAVAAMQKAVADDNKDGRLFFELDQLEEQASVPAEKRLTVLEQNQATVLQRDDAVQQEIGLYVELGKYDKAIDLLTHRHFHTWEGGGEIHSNYIDAYVMRGRQFMNARKYRAALADFQKALEYPDNLEVGRPENAPRDVEIYYLMGTAQQKLKLAKYAHASFEKAASATVRMGRRNSVGDVRYFQALALRELGHEAEATTAFNELADQGRQQLRRLEDNDFFSKFGEKRTANQVAAEAHYHVGLGLLGIGKKQEARAEFQSAIEKNANHLGARTELQTLN